MFGSFDALALFGLLLETSYKGSVAIVMVTIAITVFGRKLGARARYALWLLVLLRLALPVTVSSTWSVFNLVAPEQGVRHVVAPPPTRLRIAVDPGGTPQVLRVGSPTPSPLWSVAAAVWAAGALLLLTHALLSSVRLQRSVRSAGRRHESNSELDAMISSAAAGLGITRRIRVLVADGIVTPALHGVVSPTLLLPRSVVLRFDATELRHIILHELWHLRRHDVAINWLLVVVQAVHWFNPLVWFAAARVREEREICCDELALSCLEEDERSDYGTTILKLLEGFRTAQPIPALVGIVNPKQQMKRRLTMIASFKTDKRVPLLFAGILAVVGATAFTDPARAGEAKRMHFRTALDPQVRATMDKLHQRVSLTLTNATLSELVNAVAAKNGVTISQAPELASHKVQQARFTVDATDVPGHLILMHALMPFELMPKPSADGVTIQAGGRMHMIHAEAGHGPTPADEPGTKKRVVIIEGEKAAGEHGIDVHELRQPTEGERRLIIRSQGHAAPKPDADGRLRSEFTVQFEENGVKSEGKLKLDIDTQ